MRHIVFILGSYYPRFSAVGICAHRVIEILKAEYKISVVAIAGEDASDAHISLGGVDVYRITTPENIRRSAIKDRLQNGGGRQARLALMALRIKSAMRRLFSKRTIDTSLVTAYLDQLRKLGKVDVLVPLVLPFESVMAALDYASTNSNTLVIPYLFDNFVESKSLHVMDLSRRLKQSNHLRLEAQMIECSAAVLAMHPLQRHFEAFFSPAANAKIRFLEHPLLVRSSSVALQPSRTVRLTYAGALIHKVRDADYLVDLLEKLPGPELDVDFYVMGNAAGQIKSVSTRSGIRIHNHGQVSKAVATAAIESSSILLSIGEYRGRQISSKIFEYMAAGKPIIHLAYIEDEVDTRILSKYPLALCLLQKPDLFADNCCKMREFITRHAGSHLDFDAVAEIYPEALPEVSASIVREIVEAPHN